MIIEITKEQYDLIETEIIRLENVRSTEDLSTWGFIAISEEIETLRRIWQTEKIDLNKLN